MTASDSSRTRIGERIHRMAMAEGAVLVRFAGGSRFVRRDAATGEWTSDALSDALKAEIRTNRAALAVYADGVFADMDAPPPRIGSSGRPRGNLANAARWRVGSD